MDAVSLPPLALKGARACASVHSLEVSIMIDYVQLTTSGRVGEAAGGKRTRSVVLTQIGPRSHPSALLLRHGVSKLTTNQELQLLPLIIKV